MKKIILFVVALLLTAGAAQSQVRIGGNSQPNAAAVLDLNATDAINNGTKTLALPRVSLTSTTDNLSNATLLNGMLVYNTNTTTGAGVYYWDTNQWIKVSDGTFVEGDGVVGNEIADVVTGGGLKRYGNGTNSDAYKVGLDTAKIPPGGTWILWKPTFTAHAWRPTVGAVVSGVQQWNLPITRTWSPGTLMSWDTSMVQGGPFLLAMGPANCWTETGRAIVCVNTGPSAIVPGARFTVASLLW